MTTIATCPRCESEHTGYEPGELVQCTICNTKFTHTPPLGRPIVLADLIRNHFLNKRVGHTEHVVFAIDHDHPVHATANGAAVYVKDSHGAEYRILVENH